VTPKKKPRGTHAIYVVDLDPNVWQKRATMRKANPRYMPLTGKGYLYVGATSKTPEARFEVHKEGGLYSAPVVRIFGRYLRKRLYSGYKRMSRKDAEEMEPYVAERLRKKGYAVWPVKEGGLFTMNGKSPR
jgi:predicted GIY-YIG superfamily endonuclease